MAKEKMDFEEQAKPASFPKEIILVKPFVLSLKMPGQHSSRVTQFFRANQIVIDPEIIEKLVKAEAPIHILRK